MIRFPKPDCPILADLPYVSPNFNCYDPPVMYITYYMFTHKIVALIGCIDIGGLSWIFLKGVQNDISIFSLPCISGLEKYL
jgi:hypothetical protein